MRIASIVFTLCLLLGEILTAAPKYPDSKSVRSILQERIDTYKKSSGIVVGLIDSSGSQITAYGKTSDANPTQPDGDTVFEIGSITKVFTSVLLSDMVQRKELNLNDPISKFLPATVKVPSRNGKQITLLDLATHTSALPRLPSNLLPKDNQNPYADYTFQQMYDFLSGYTLTRDIGSQYEYSNFGAGLLGHILGLKAGTDYESLVVNRICTPLGLKSTRIKLTPEMKAHLAQPHDETGQPTSNWDIPTLAGAGALRSSANDLLLFLAANMQLKKSSLDAALKQTHVPQRSTIFPDTRIGLAWHITKRNGSEIVWHNGGTGGYHSFLGFDHVSGTGVVVLSNSANDIDDIGFHLLNFEFELAKLEAPREHKETHVDPKLYDAYVGSYQLAPGFILSITKENDRIYLQATGQPRFEIFPESETVYFLKVVDAQITFMKDKTGKVNALVLHQNGTDNTAQKLGKDYQPPAHKEIAVDPKILAKYVGRYELVPGVVFGVTLQEGKLMAQLSGQDAFQVFPESQTDFFYKVVDAQITFQTDKDGNVTGLILHQGGIDRSAKRIR